MSSGLWPAWSWHLLPIPERRWLRAFSATDAQGYDDGVDWGGYDKVGSPMTCHYVQMFVCERHQAGLQRGKVRRHSWHEAGQQFATDSPVFAFARVIVSSTTAFDGALCGPVAFWRPHHRWRGTSGIQTLCRPCCTCRLASQQGLELAGQHAHRFCVGERQVFFLFQLITF